MGLVALMAVLSYNDWFKVTKVITLKTQYCSVDKVCERKHNKDWILYYLFQPKLLFTGNLEVSTVSRKIKWC